MFECLGLEEKSVNVGGAVVSGFLLEVSEEASEEVSCLDSTSDHGEGGRTSRKDHAERGQCTFNKDNYEREMEYPRLLGSSFLDSGEMLVYRFARFRCRVSVCVCCCGVVFTTSQCFGNDSLLGRVRNDSTRVLRMNPFWLGHIR